MDPVLSDDTVSIQDDPHKLALLKHYRSLMPMAQEARKPMFHLKPADGAIGAHFQSAQEAFKDFRKLAKVIRDKAHIPSPPSPPPTPETPPSHSATPQ